MICIGVEQDTLIIFDAKIRKGKSMDSSKLPFVGLNYNKLSHIDRLFFFIQNYVLNKDHNIPYQPEYSVSHNDHFEQSANNSRPHKPHKHEAHTKPKVCVSMLLVSFTPFAR